MTNIKLIQNKLHHLTKKVEWFNEQTSIRVYGDDPSFISQTLIRVSKKVLRGFKFNSVELDHEKKMCLLFIKK